MSLLLFLEVRSFTRTALTWYRISEATRRFLPYFRNVAIFLVLMFRILCLHIQLIFRIKIVRDSNFFVCSTKLSDSVNFRNFFPRIVRIPLQKLFLKFETNRTTFYNLQKVAISRYP